MFYILIFTCETLYTFSLRIVGRSLRIKLYPKDCFTVTVVHVENKKLVKHSLIIAYTQQTRFPLKVLLWS